MDLPNRSDIPEHFVPRHPKDHEWREVMIPMRDGVYLHTVIVVPIGASHAPTVLARTPYSFAKHMGTAGSPHAAALLRPYFGELISAGYIAVIQHIRGKFKSEGRYVMNRPLQGMLNPDPVDHSTDAWDTIEWLVRHVPESNGRVGTIGISYDGFTTLMSLVDPHPALCAAVPINPMVDCWIGDDWFRNGAFRQHITVPYVYQQTTRADSDLPWPAAGHDDYDTYLHAGSAGALASRVGMDELPFWRRLTQHPAYDDYWKAQALDKILADRPHTVPTLHVRSQWDAEDIYGPMAAYLALEAQDTANDRNFLAIGPWTHTGAAFGDGAGLGAIRYGSDTAKWFRAHVLRPFLDRHLRNDPSVPAIAPVTVFETGSNTWLQHDAWPPRDPSGQAVGTQPLYLQSRFGLGFAEPTSRDEQSFDEFISDPAKPVPYQTRPIRPRGSAGSRWDGWLVEDQRFASDRSDVLTYVSSVLDAPLRLAGQPVAHLFASTSASDGDWMVKLIDVFPDQVHGDPAMGGYQMPVAMEMLRGRYRSDPSTPMPIPSDECLHYTIALPHVSHAFLPGHRLMVQVQSSCFPLYDRNPQTFVPNIFFAPPEAYVKAVHRVYRLAGAASRIDLPVVR